MNNWLNEAVRKYTTLGKGAPEEYLGEELPEVDLFTKESQDDEDEIYNC